MASITREADGRRTIQFVGADRKRRSIRLGKISQRSTEAVKFRVEQLVAAKITSHTVDDETSRWVASLSEPMYKKLAAVGLLPKREPAKQTTLQAFLDAYIAGRTDVKESTKKTGYAQPRSNLIDFFGPDKLLGAITAGDADDWRIWLGAKVGKITLAKRCKTAKQFFRAAVRRKLIAENPFADLASATQRNEKRFYFLTRVEAQKVIDACPDAQWRLLFALSRYGGLRCPSEHLGLRWGDVDWEKGRMTIHSPKTERHEGRESRQIPLFPELRPYLEVVFEAAEPGTEFVITRYRDVNANLRTRLLKIIKRAGLKPWPKLFQNLRSTRQTELAETYPNHVVCAWMGNTEPVAVKHYLQVTDEHYRLAVEAVQNPVQHTPVSHSTASHDAPAESVDPLVFSGMRDDAKPCDDCSFVKVGPEGFEPPTKGL